MFQATLAGRRSLLSLVETDPGTARPDLCIDPTEPDGESVK